MESGIWEYEKIKVKKWCIGYVWKKINRDMLFDGDIYLVIYFYEESILKNKFCIFPDSQKKNIILYILLFNTLASKKSIFSIFSQIPETFSAHRLNSFFAGVYLYSLSCCQKAAQNAVTHCGTNIFPDSCPAAHF